MPRNSHLPIGDPCVECGKTIHAHFDRYYAGIDGEGIGRAPHRYTLLAWSNELATKQNHIESQAGLTTTECLDFILSIPTGASIFAFAFSYDLAKILQDIDNETLYKLFRPETRQRPKELSKFGPYPVKWGRYSLNLQATKFSVEVKSPKGVRQRRVIWDIFKFYQKKFTRALTEWKASDPATIAAIEEMKNKRGVFQDADKDAILKYCYSECSDLARLTRKLCDAHHKAGLPLKTFYGAGSTASAMLKKMGIREQVDEGPSEINEAVASAFFGGRFENSVIGPIPERVHGYDISSAYPYQLYQMPCLKCGKWEHTRYRYRLDDCTMALVRYSLGPDDNIRSWAPFPFRTEVGTIAFPAKSGGGWLWSSEYLAGEKLFLSTRFHEAWVYKTDCNHRPFEHVPQWYLERLRLGKEGPGIVIKNGSNSIYGKVAQSVGVSKPPYQCWIWAGMVTAGTRAQLLTLMGHHNDMSNVLMVATDGLYTRERLDPPAPIDTGTYSEHKKPLGGWEHKEIEKGMFAARPGIYFPLNPTDDEIDAIRARGIGRAALFRYWREMCDAYANGLSKVKIGEVSRFHGAKSSIYRAGKTYKRSPLYGEWKESPVILSFAPMPKRQRIGPDGKLELRSFLMSDTSMPYDRSLSPESILLKLAGIIASEQPEGLSSAEFSIEETT